MCSPPSLNLANLWRTAPRSAPRWTGSAPNTADLLRRATLHTDLITLIFPPGSHEGGQVVVTVDDGREFTWLGSPADLGHLYDIYGDDLSEAAIEALSDAWQLHIIDPVWGRNDLLWNVLRRFAGTTG